MREIIMRKKVLVFILVMLAILFPLMTDNNYTIHIMTLAFIWTIAVYGLNLLAGFTGYLSLGHAGFFAIGAYSIGILTVKYSFNYWLAFVLALVITIGIGFIIGLVALRTKEHFFAIYTLCVGVIIYLVITKWDDVTGGVRGLIGVPQPEAIGPISFKTPMANYYLVLFFLLLTILVMYLIVKSLVGRTFISIRNSEELAQTLGINTRWNKLLSFVVSTFFAGLGGVLYASFIRFLGPEIGYINVTFDILVYMMIGGIGTLTGPLVGTISIVWLSEKLQFLQDYRMLIFGPLLTILIIFAPRGLAGLYDQLKMKWHIRKKKRKDSNGKDKAETKEGANVSGN